MRRSKIGNRLPDSLDCGRRDLVSPSISAAAILVVVGTMPAMTINAQTQAALQVSERSGPRICGVVRDASPKVRFDEEFIAQVAKVQSVEDFRKLTHEEPEAVALSKVVVHLRGQTEKREKIARETVTDEHGQYFFDGLPEGEYEVWAELDPRPAERGDAREIAMGKATVRIGSYPGPNGYQLGRHEFPVYGADLEVRSDVMTVRGRVTDNQGRPVASARVTCTDQFDAQDQRSETSEGDRFLERRTVSAVTSADGTYELRGVKPPEMYYAAGYLNGGSGGSAVKRLLEVKADGYRPERRSVPLVTEELRNKSRRLLAAFAELEQREREARPSTRPAQIVGEKPRVHLPASSGNVITGEDFVLQPAMASTRPAGDR